MNTDNVLVEKMLHHLAGVVMINPGQTIDQFIAVYRANSDDFETTAVVEKLLHYLAGVLYNSDPVPTLSAFSGFSDPITVRLQTELQSTSAFALLRELEEHPWDALLEAGKRLFPEFLLAENKGQAAKLEYIKQLRECEVVEQKTQEYVAAVSFRNKLLNQIQFEVDVLEDIPANSLCTLYTNEPTAGIKRAVIKHEYTGRSQVDGFVKATFKAGDKATLFTVGVVHQLGIVPGKVVLSANGRGYQSADAANDDVIGVSFYPNSFVLFSNFACVLDLYSGYYKSMYSADAQAATFVNGYRNHPECYSVKDVENALLKRVPQLLAGIDLSGLSGGGIGRDATLNAYLRHDPVYKLLLELSPGFKIPVDSDNPVGCTIVHIPQPTKEHA